MAVFLLIETCESNSADLSIQDTIRIKANETFELKLEAPPGTGFRWMMADSSYQSLLRLYDSYTVRLKDMDHESETQVFVFKGLRKGKVPLHFVFNRSWEKNEPPRKEKKYTVMVE